MGGVWHVGHAGSHPSPGSSAAIPQGDSSALGAFLAASRMAAEMAAPRGPCLAGCRRRARGFSPELKVDFQRWCLSWGWRYLKAVNGVVLEGFYQMSPEALHLLASHLSILPSVSADPEILRTNPAVPAIFLVLSCSAR